MKAEKKKAIVVRVKAGHEPLGKHVAGFFRKLGHDVKVVGVTALELPIEIAFAGSGAGGDE